MTFSQSDINVEVEKLLASKATASDILRPFPQFSELDGDLKLSVECGELILADLRILGSLTLENGSVSYLNLRYCTIGDKLSIINFQAVEVNLQGITVGSTVNISLSEIGRIRCHAKQAEALHYAAPTTPLVTEGLLG